MIILTYFISVGGNNEGKKTVRKGLLDRSITKKNYLRMERKKNIEGYISINRRIAGWNMGVPGLGSCLMSRPAIAGVAWSMISCRVRSFNATVNSQNFMTEA